MQRSIDVTATLDALAQLTAPASGPTVMDGMAVVWVVLWVACAILSVREKIYE